jgi:hypothetical protein
VVKNFRIMRRFYSALRISRLNSNAPEVVNQDGSLAAMRAVRFLALFQARAVDANHPDTNLLVAALIVSRRPTTPAWSEAFPSDRFTLITADMQWRSFSRVTRYPAICGPHPSGSGGKDAKRCDLWLWCREASSRKYPARPA